MSLQISCQSLSKSFSTQDLFKDISFGIHENEKLGLIGPNGSGKSTLLKILFGLEKPDKGEVAVKKGLNLVYLAQTETYNKSHTIEEILLESLHEDIDINDKYVLVDRILKQAGFENSSQIFGELSGGWRKRVAIASALIQSPDVLFMDEPTNHLDLESIEALNYALSIFEGTVIFVSHDREFVGSLATRIIEVTPEGIHDFKGTYDEYLDHEGGDFFKRLTSGGITAKK